MNSNIATVILKGSSYGNIVNSANNNKLMYFSRLLKDGDLDLYIFTGISYFIPGNNEAIILSATDNNVNYYNAGLTIKPTTVLSKILNKFAYYQNIYSAFLHVSKKHDKIIVILDHCSISFFLYIYLIAQKYNTPLVFYIEEWFQAHYDQTLIFRFKSKVLNLLAFNLFDGVIAISDYLCKKAIKVNPELKIYKLPSLSDYNENIIKDIPVNNEDVFVYLFCTSLSYINELWKIIHSFSAVAQVVGRDKIRLKLIVNGSPSSMVTFIEEINKFCELQIHVLTELSADELFDQYRSSDVLLAPLNCDIRSNAKFPQKIAEYCSTSRPIITSSVGDIPYYFKHKESAFIINEFSVNEMTSMMLYVFNNQLTLSDVGQKGYMVGAKYFDPKIHRIPFSSYLNHFFGTK